MIVKSPLGLMTGKSLMGYWWMASSNRERPTVHSSAFRALDMTPNITLVTLRVRTMPRSSGWSNSLTRSLGGATGHGPRVKNKSYPRPISVGFFSLTDSPNCLTVKLLWNCTALTLTLNQIPSNSKALNKYRGGRAIHLELDLPSYLIVKSNGYKLAFVAMDVDCQPVPSNKPRKTSQGQKVPNVTKLPEAVRAVAAAAGGHMETAPGTTGEHQPKLRLLGKP